MATVKYTGNSRLHRAYTTKPQMSVHKIDLQLKHMFAVSSTTFLSSLPILCSSVGCVRRRRSHGSGNQLIVYA